MISIFSSEKVRCTPPPHRLLMERNHMGLGVELEGEMGEMVQNVFFKLALTQYWVTI